MQLLLAVLNALLLHIYRPFKIKPKFDSKVFVILFKTGFPLFITSYLVQFVDTIPRLFIINYGNETMLGIFSPAILMISSFALLPNSLSTYYYPKLSYQFGKTGDANMLFKQLLKIYVVSFFVFIPFIILAYLFIDDILVYFPKYKASAPYIKICLLVVPFVLAKLGNLINVILKKVKFMAIYAGTYFVCQVVSILILKQFFEDILFIASWSIVITFVILFITCIVINKRVVVLYSEYSR